MIGRIQGKIVYKHPPQLLVDVQGVGYEIDAPMSTFYQLPATGSEVTLHTHLVVRDDAHLLFGFASQPERALFRSLIKVSGIGARLALTILSGMNAEEFVRCVHDDDTAALVRLPGIGKKTAERLIIELRDRLKDDQLPMGTSLPAAGGVSSASPVSPVGDAVSALIALGYKPQEASKMVRAVNAEGMDTEDIIRLSLQGAVAK